MEFTSQQQKVIDTRDRNILVSAAAGSGKTAVLVERILALIKDGPEPVDIDRLLVVTFTRAAAAQMRERIGAALRRWSAEEGHDPMLAAHMARQETLLHNAQITTIDSFCAYLIRNHFAEAGIDPSVRVMPETERGILFGDVLSGLIEEAYAAGDPEIRLCADYFCQGLADSELEKLLTDLYNAADSHPYPIPYLEERGRDYDPQEGIRPVDRYLLDLGRERLRDSAETFEELRQNALASGGPYPYADVLLKDEDACRQAADMLDHRLREAAPQTAAELAGLIRDAYDAADSGLAPKLPVIRSSQYPDVEEFLKKQVQDARKNVIKGIRDFRDGFLTADAEAQVERDRLCADAVRAVAHMAIRFRQAFDEKKKARNAVDFGDMEHLALQILVQDGEATETARMYRRLYDEIMIDEYQDSNMVQELLLRTISGTDDGHFNRFMVGDVKQSIYRFRQARPEIFIEKAAVYQPDGDTRVRIDLDRNFRSRRQVLDTVNTLFARLMRHEIGGIDYDESQFLNRGMDFPEGDDPAAYDTELILIDTEADRDLDPSASAEEEEGRDGGEQPAARMTAAEREAAAIGARILEMIGQRFMISDGDGGMRPVRYADMAVLLRSDGGWNDVFRSVFEEMHIPVYVQSGSGYFGTQEIRDVIQLLKIIDNPLQDIPFYGAMRSYFGGFTEEDAAWVRIIGRQLRTAEDSAKEKEQDLLYHQMQRIVQDGNAENMGARWPALADRCRQFMQSLDEYRRMAVYLDMESLLNRIIDGTGYLNYCTALPSGAARRANLMMLVRRAAEFETTQYSGLFRFLQYIEQMQTYQIDMGEAGLFDERSDAVRILTIHKSKGLEYPVCFVAGLGRGMNSRDASQSLVIDSDLGLGIDAVDLGRRVKYPTLRKQVIAEKIRRDTMGEELRVLYVAMTRAREKLILCGSVKEAPRYAASASEETGSRPLSPGAQEAGRKAAPLRTSEIRASRSFAELILKARAAALKDGEPDPVRIRVASDAGLSDAGSESMERAAGRRRALDMAAAAYLAEGEKALPDPAFAARLTDRFAFRYAYGALSELYTKTTVSELKKAAMYRLEEDENEAGERTVPVVKGEYLGADYGTAVHRVMELMDERIFGMDGECRIEDVTGWIRALREEGKISADEFALIRPDALLPFFHTKLFRRMCEAYHDARLFREQPFVMNVPASRLNETFPEEETVLVQGIIDAFFLEEDGIILLDYKTDTVGEEKTLQDRYAIQLEYYASALERLFRRPVRERLIYSFCLDRVITVGRP